MTPKFGAVISPLQLLHSVIEAAEGLTKEVQQAKTDRAEIEAWKQTETNRIHAQREVLLKALDLTFDERRENFRRLFDGLDSALASGNNERVGSFLESITDLAKISPFKDLADIEIVAAELKRPGRVWDV